VVVEAIRHFSPYLYGREFVVFTDHQSLYVLMTSDHLNGRLKRLSMKLQPWLVKFVHLPGKDNTLADALLRQDFKKERDKDDQTRPESCPSLPPGGCGEPSPQKQKKEEEREVPERAENEFAT